MLKLRYSSFETGDSKSPSEPPVWEFHQDFVLGMVEEGMPLFGTEDARGAKALLLPF